MSDDPVPGPLGFPQHLLAFLFLISLFLPVASCANRNTQDTDPAQAQQEADSVRALTVELELMAENMTAPVTLADPPGAGGRRFIVDQAGIIHLLTPEGKLRDKPFLDLRDLIVELKPEHEERGLLGLAFHPDYRQNGRFFVYYSVPLQPEAPQGFDHTSRISEFTVSEDPAVADPESEQILLQVDQPQANHNAGTLSFGSDGYLYVSLGDGGGANDTARAHVPDWYDRNEGGNGQDTDNNLLGSILRLDVNSGSPYAIPEDNPFVGRESMDEIYAYGLRNPYRFSFDREGTGELIAADAGQALWEEVNVISPGGNYGWNVKEATHCFNASNNKQPPEECPDADSAGNELIDPVIEFETGNADEGGQGLVVIGGYVYRGAAIPALEGTYLFGTWTRQHGTPKGALFAAEPDEEGMWGFRKLEVQRGDSTGLGHYLLGFGRDNSGELYVMTIDREGPVGSTGKVYKVTGYGTAE